MTAADYFEYCKITYIAGKQKGEEVDEALSGREMYMLVNILTLLSTELFYCVEAILVGEPACRFPQNPKYQNLLFLFEAPRSLFHCGKLDPKLIFACHCS
jgi:hypothetical protein